MRHTSPGLSFYFLLTLSVSSNKLDSLRTSQWGDSQYRNAVASGILRQRSNKRNADPTLPRYGTDYRPTAIRLRTRRSRNHISYISIFQQFIERADILIHHRIKSLFDSRQLLFEHRM